MLSCRFTGMSNCILRILLLFIVLLLATIGCNQSASVGNFDAESWKSDQNGCKEDRLKLYQSLLNNQDDLLGLNNRQIVKLLGMPERNELYQRNQKFFIYDLSPSSVCQTDYDGARLFLFIRFNAVGLSQEIFVQDQPNFKP